MVGYLVGYLVGLLLCGDCFGERLFQCRKHELDEWCGLTCSIGFSESFVVVALAGVDQAFDGKVGEVGFPTVASVASGKP